MYIGLLILAVFITIIQLGFESVSKQNTSRKEAKDSRDAQLYLFIKRRSCILDKNDRIKADIIEVQKILSGRGAIIKNKDVLSYWDAVKTGDKSVINDEDYFNNKYRYDRFQHINAENDEYWYSLVDYDLSTDPGYDIDRGF